MTALFFIGSAPLSGRFRVGALRSGSGKKRRPGHSQRDLGALSTATVPRVADVACPGCGEEEDLLGRSDGPPGAQRITVSCQSCGLSWVRDLTPRCPECGSTEVRSALRSIVDKSRGTQLSIQSLSVEYLCPGCDAEELAVWNRSNTPLPPRELPHDPL